MYIVVLGAVIYGSMLLSGLSHVRVGRACSVEVACIDAGDKPLFAWSLAILLAGVVASAASALGPMAASSGEASWLLSTPMDRFHLLRMRLVRATAIVTVVTGASGWFVWHSAHGVQGETNFGTGTITSIVTGALIGAGIVAAASLAQAHPRWELCWRRIPTAMVGMGFFVCLSVLVHLGFGANLIGDLVPGAPIALLALLVVAGLVAGAARSLRRIPSSRLRQGGRLQESLSSSVSAMDLSHASQQLANQRGARRQRRRTIPGRGGGAAALMLRDVLAMFRRGRVWAGIAVSTIGPSLVLVLFGSRLALIVMILMSTFVARSTAVGLTTLTRSPGLARAFPLATSKIRLALIASPTLGALLWMLPVAVLTATEPLNASAIALAGVAGACRAAGGAPIGSTGPIVMTSSGVLPIGMMMQLIRGIDVALLSAAPLFFGLPAPLTILFPLVYIALHVARPPRGWIQVPAMASGR